MSPMRANIVPLYRRFHVHVAMLACVVVTVLLAARPLSPESEFPEAPMLGDGEPRFSEDRHALLWGDSFDAPPSEIRGARYGRYLTLDARPLHFERGGGVDGTGAVRIDWSTQDTTRARCADDSHVLEASFAPSREIVVSYSVRYSPGFAFDWSGRPGCTGNAKKLFLLWARAGSRFVFVSENGALGVGSDYDHPLFSQNLGTRVNPRDLADGAWHRVTLRVRQGSTTTSADGAIHGWIDGVQRWQYDNIVTHNAGGYYLFKMPATFNAGSPVAQTEWMDDLRIWRTR